MLRKLGLLLILFLLFACSGSGVEKEETKTEEGEDLYWLVIEEQIKELPLDKAVKLGKGEKVLIIFVNPDCPHCRNEWKVLRKHLDKLKIYAFVIPFKGWGEENLKKSLYIVCSENPEKAFDEVLTGKMDNKDINPPTCDKLEAHFKAAEIVGLRAVPLNILPEQRKVIEGENPKLFEYLGIKAQRE
ncbi:thioredoxin fold domain-containing protein [Aquifex sp.]